MSKPISNQELLDTISAAVSKSIQTATGADAAVGAARTKSNSETDTDSATETVFKSVQQDSDIGVPEAWSANVKRTYDVHQSEDLYDGRKNRVHFDALVSQQLKHVANVDAMNLQSIANNQNQSNVGNGMLIDRAWNVNETDAFAVLLNKVVAEATKAVLAQLDAR